MNNPNDMVTMGVRLRISQRRSLNTIAKTHYNTPSSLIRLAVDNLILATAKNGGQLPEPIALRIQEEAAEGAYQVIPRREAAAAAAAAGQ